jgi:hypothetical protein
MRTDVAPDGATVGGDDVLAHMQADARTFAFFGIHPSMVFYPEELLEDALAELGWDTRAGIRHGTMQDRPVPGHGILPGHHDPHDSSGVSRLTGGWAALAPTIRTRGLEISTRLRIGFSPSASTPHRLYSLPQAWQHYPPTATNRQRPQSALISNCGGLHDACSWWHQYARGSSERWTEPLRSSTSCPLTSVSHIVPRSSTSRASTTTQSSLPQQRLPLALW